MRRHACASACSPAGERGGGLALVRRALGSARRRPRRCRLFAATAAPAGARDRLLLAEPGESRSIRTPIGLAVLDALRARWPSAARFSSHSTTCSGSIRLRRRDPDRPSPTPRGTGRALRDAPAGPGAGQSARARSVVHTRGRLEQLTTRAAQPGRCASSAGGAPRSRADPARAGTCAGSNCGQPVLRSRGRPRARPNEHAAGAGPGAARTGQPA